MGKQWVRVYWFGAKRERFRSKKAIKRIKAIRWYISGSPSDERYHELTYRREGLTLEAQWIRKKQVYTSESEKRFVEKVSRERNIEAGKEVFGSLCESVRSRKGAPSAWKYCHVIWSDVNCKRFHESQPMAVDYLRSMCWKSILKSRYRMSRMVQWPHSWRCRTKLMKEAERWRGKCFTDLSYRDSSVASNILRMKLV